MLQSSLFEPFLNHVSVSRALKYQWILLLFCPEWQSCQQFPILRNQQQCYLSLAVMVLRTLSQFYQYLLIFSLFRLYQLLRNITCPKKPVYTPLCSAFNTNQPVCPWVLSRCSAISGYSGTIKVKGWSCRLRTPNNTFFLSRELENLYYFRCYKFHRYQNIKNKVIPSSVIRETLPFQTVFSSCDSLGTLSICCKKKVKSACKQIESNLRS